MNKFDNKSLCVEVLFTPKIFDFSFNLFVRFKSGELNIWNFSNIILFVFIVDARCKYHIDDIEHASTYMVCLNMFKIFLIYQSSICEDKYISQFK